MKIECCGQCDEECPLESKVWSKGHRHEDWMAGGAFLAAILTIGLGVSFASYYVSSLF